MAHEDNLISLLHLWNTKHFDAKLLIGANL